MWFSEFVNRLLRRTVTVSLFVVALSFSWSGVAEAQQGLNYPYLRQRMIQSHAPWQPPVSQYSKKLGTQVKTSVVRREAKKLGVKQSTRTPKRTHYAPLNYAQLLQSVKEHRKQPNR